MKKSTFILAAAAVSFALVGCEKKGSVEQQASGELIEKTFYANQGGKEKTTLNPSTLATLWTAGDALKVYPETGGAGNDFTLAGGAGESEATFTGLTTLSDVYVAFYPAGNAKSISGSKVTFSMPAVQTITSAGSFNTNTVPMVGYTTDEALAMKNVGSLFELGLKAKTGTPKVVKIELIGNNGENLAGDFTVDASVSGQPTAAYSANGATTLTINCGEYSSGKYQGIALNASSYTYFYISIPASVFTSGFTAKLTDADGKIAEVTTTADIHKGAATLTEFKAENIEFKFCRQCSYTETVTDVCGNTYNLVTIGSQTWMAENMRCGRYSDGTTIHTEAEYTGTYDPYYYDNGDYGYLYNWSAAMHLSASEASSYTGVYEGICQGVCPSGFHIPNREEFDALRSAAGSNPGVHLKTCGGWNSNDGDNNTCFSALPAGYYRKGYGDEPAEVGVSANFWSTESRVATSAYYGYLRNASPSLGYDFFIKSTLAHSVRCIKD